VADSSQKNETEEAKYNGFFSTQIPLLMLHEGKIQHLFRCLAR